MSWSELSCQKGLPMRETSLVRHSRRRVLPTMHLRRTPPNSTTLEAGDAAASRSKPLIVMLRDLL